MLDESLRYCVWIHLIFFPLSEFEESLQNHASKREKGSSSGSSRKGLNSKLPGNADFHLFKAGIEPKWEDPECANGGKWSVTSNRKANLENMWLETLMALIGEQFDDADEICGVVASVRQRQDKLALWTKTATNEAAQMGIGRKWKEIIDVNDKITYGFHDDSRRERSAKSRYSV